MDAAAPHRPDARRRSRITAAIAALALLLAPAIGLSAAQAAPGDLIGDTLGGPAWPDGTLAAMVEGEPYSDRLHAPFDYDDRDHGVPFDVSGLPAGLSADLNPGNARQILITGTPTEVGELDFTVTWYGTEGYFVEIRFTGSIESGKLATTPTITVASPVVAYTAIALSATVPAVGGSGTPTGTVQFWTDPATWGSSRLVASATLDGAGTAGTTWTGMDAAEVGAELGFIARYIGDDVYAPGGSAVAATLPYIPTAAGIVLINGEPVSGAVVRLLDAADPVTVVASFTTGADGEFSLQPGVAATVLEVQRRFLVEATLPGGPTLYGTLAGTPGVTDIDDADEVGRLTWTSSLVIEQLVPPVWSDVTLAAMRAGSAYADAVAATSPSAVSYSISAGSLPAGLALDSASGAITGTPSCPVEPCSYAFTVRASNIAGVITHDFSGMLLPAGVPPTWTDDALADDLQVGMAVLDGVVAVGDPVIVYALASGALPPGLTLSTATGAITGTPTLVGEYTFSISATNDYGSIVADFTRSVAAAPELELELDFAAGTRIEDAASLISASGLKIGSTYTLTMHSAPVLLYTGVVGPSGGFSWTVSLPLDTPPGAHELVLRGIAPDDSSLTARAWFVLLADGRIAAISYSGPLNAAAYLADTGLELAPVLGAAGLLLAGGALLLAVARRRTLRTG